VQGRRYSVSCERAIVRSQRQVVATAYDERGVVARQQEMNTSAARVHLRRPPEQQPPEWEELEELAVRLLQLELEE